MSRKAIEEKVRWILREELICGKDNCMALVDLGEAKSRLTDFIMERENLHKAHTEQNYRQIDARGDILEQRGNKIEELEKVLSNAHEVFGAESDSIGKIVEELKKRERSLVEASQDVIRGHKFREDGSITGISVSDINCLGYALKSLGYSDGGGR